MQEHSILRGEDAMTTVMRDSMRTPVDKRRPLPRGDISDVIEKRKAELARLKREVRPRHH